MQKTDVTDSHCADGLQAKGGNQVIDTVKGVKFDLRCVPAGSFQLRQDGKSDPDGAQITMTISKPFLMAETPVTQELWQAYSVKKIEQ